MPPFSCESINIQKVPSLHACQRTNESMQMDTTVKWMDCAAPRMYSASSSPYANVMKPFDKPLGLLFRANKVRRNFHIEQMCLILFIMEVFTCLFCVIDSWYLKVNYNSLMNYGWIVEHNCTCSTILDKYVRICNNIVPSFFAGSNRDTMANVKLFKKFYLKILLQSLCSALLIQCKFWKM